MHSERLGHPVLFSAVCHVALFSGSLLWSAWHTPLSLGQPEGSIGGAVPVTPIDGVPITGSRTRANPVANPVQHDVPGNPRDVKPVSSSLSPEGLSLIHI